MNVLATTNNISTTGAHSSTSSTSSNSDTSPTDKLASEQTFLQLFVTQLKNQDPENPADGTQFVTQLAQFSQLEQSLQMREDLDAINQNVQTAVAAVDPSANGSTGSSTGSDTTNGSRTTSRS